MTNHHHPVQRSRMSCTITLLQPTCLHGMHNNPTFFMVKHKIPYFYGTYTAKGIYLLVSLLICCEETFEALCDYQIKKNHSFLSCIRKYHEREKYKGGDLCIIIHSFKKNGNIKWHTLILLFCLRPSLVLEVDMALHSSTWMALA